MTRRQFQASALALCTLGRQTYASNDVAQVPTETITLDCLQAHADGLYRVSAELLRAEYLKVEERAVDLQAIIEVLIKDAKSLLAKLPDVQAHQELVEVSEYLVVASEALEAPLVPHSIRTFGRAIGDASVQGASLLSTLDTHSDATGAVLIDQGVIIEIREFLLRIVKIDSTMRYWHEARKGLEAAQTEIHRSLDQVRLKLSQVRSDLSRAADEHNPDIQKSLVHSASSGLSEIAGILRHLAEPQALHEESFTLELASMMEALSVQASDQYRPLGSEIVSTSGPNSSGIRVDTAAIVSFESLATFVRKHGFVCGWWDASKLWFYIFPFRFWKVSDIRKRSAILAYIETEFGPTYDSRRRPKGENRVIAAQALRDGLYDRIIA